jgi:hypothetical protein
LSLLNDTQKVPLHPLARVKPGAFGPLAHQKEEEEEGKLHFSPLTIGSILIHSLIYKTE